jgi:hypothetical protein
VDVDDDIVLARPLDFADLDDSITALVSLAE